MEKGKIAVVGDRDIVSIFKAIGFSVFYADTVETVQQEIKKIYKDYQIIFITDNFAKKLSNELKKYEAKAYPIIIPIPSAEGSNGYGMDRIKENIEKAVGMNILEG